MERKKFGKALPLLVCFLLPLLLSGCTDVKFESPTIPSPSWPFSNNTGSGNIISQERTLPPFHSLEAQGVSTIFITQESPTRVRVEADENALDRVSTSVANGVLITNTEGNFKTAAAVKIYISTPELRRIKLQGVGSITTVNDISVDELSVDSPGAGNITLTGIADTFQATLSGVGNVEALDLTTRKSSVTVSGLGSCRVTVTDELDATISGNGNIYYAGDPPVVNYTNTGWGQLIHL
jgi:hypothetical protein